MGKRTILVIDDDLLWRKLLMRIFDGTRYDVCAALKNGAERPRFPVIVVSSDPDAELTAYAECRADYFVLKGSHAVLEHPRMVGAVLGDGGRTFARKPEH